jgi:hypothetical protein
MTLDQFSETGLRERVVIGNEDSGGHSQITSIDCDQQPPYRDRKSMSIQQTQDTQLFSTGFAPVLAQTNTWPIFVPRASSRRRFTPRRIKGNEKLL